MAIEEGAGADRRVAHHYPLWPGTPRVVVLGCGFGGLHFVRGFRGEAQVAVIDKQNHHAFQPLLYQVAMAGLSVPDVAEPIRSIFRGRMNVMTVMEEVRGIDLDRRVVQLRQSSVEYTHLVIGLGGRTSYFGNDAWAEHALGLKTVQDALDIRRRVLTSFERAETEADPDEARRLTTICVIGGGPTGVELAGTMAELAKKVFRRDFRKVDLNQVRVVLVQGADRVLPGYPDRLCEAAKRQLEELGAEVMLNTRAEAIEAGRVVLDTGEVIEARNILWGGGVVASPIAAQLGVPVDCRGRIEVEADCSLPGHPEAFAVGDIAALVDAKGKDVPGVAQGAMQMGTHVAKIINRELKTGVAKPPSERPAFAYFDKGDMATIGRSKAVAWLFKRVECTGFVAWVMWAVVHLMFLAGFRSKLATAVQWVWAYLLFRPGARIIFSPLHREVLEPSEVVSAEERAAAAAAGQARDGVGPESAAH
ncbi:MAG: NAD(P)/FAD-dependent oxidoreductase [Planctomycetota bacterium]